MSEEQKIQDDGDYPFGCWFLLLAFFLLVIAICLYDFKTGEATRRSLYALVGSVIFATGVLIRIIVKLVKSASKKSRDD